MEPRDVYKLRIDYLRQSNRYRTFCARVKKLTTKYSLEQALEKAEAEDPKFYLYHLSNYRLFGDIFSNTFDFDSWWERKGQDLAVEPFFKRHAVIARGVGENGQATISFDPWADRGELIANFRQFLKDVRDPECDDLIRYIKQTQSATTLPDATFENISRYLHVYIL